MASVSLRLPVSHEGVLVVHNQEDMSCYDLGRKRDFIISTYRLESSGVWTTDVPNTAPCGPGCRVRCHGERERVTGPRHPLLVVKCEVHGLSFTVYPPGFIPYSRQRLVPRHQRWEATMFEAALDADRDERWSDIGADGGFWSTQWRRLERLGLLLGLAGDARIGEEAAQALDVGLHVHAAAREAFERGGFRRRASALVKVLDALRSDGAEVLRRLLRAGVVTGYCGRSFWSDARFGVREVGAF